MDQNEKKKTVIDIVQLCQDVWSHRKTFFKVLPIVAILSSLFIICVPKYYTVKVELSPEDNSSLTGGIGGMLSSLGLGGLNTGEDAIYPFLYPDVIASNQFIVGLFDVKIRNASGSIQTNYYDYMLNYQKMAWWTAAWKSFKKILPKRKSSATTIVEDPSVQLAPSFYLTEQQTNIVKSIRKSITCRVDNKTNIITLIVEDQDPYVTALLADSIMQRLQDFIIDYRTKKARNDYEYSVSLFKQANDVYKDAQERYAEYATQHWNASDPSVKTQISALENEVSLAYSNVSNLNTQLQLTRAKVQERTPAFTVVDGATVPLLATGPHRTLFVIAMLFLASLCIVAWIYRCRLVNLLR